MKAHAITEFGAPNVFKIIELPRPTIKPGHVLIRVLATSVNPVDYKIRSGRIPPITPHFPAILHGDVAGIVEEVGADVADFNIGDEVFGCAGGLIGSDGALAEFMLADARLVAKKPSNLSMAEAAALPLVSITAWEALFEKVTLQPNEKVLIHGGTGGVGHIAVQLAAWAGAEVYTTVSSQEKADLIKLLGAKEAINYRHESVTDYVNRITNGKGFNIVLDTVGGTNIETSMDAVSLYGHIVTIQASATCDLSKLHSKSASLHVVFMLIPLLHNIQRERHHKILQKIAELADLGHVKPLISHLFSFEEIDVAHALAESGKAVGKIVLTRN